MYQSPIEQGEELILNDDLKLELINTFLFNLKGENDSTLEDFFIHLRDKWQTKEILMWKMIFWEPFGALLQHMKFCS
jgi:hypothetical protein